MKFLESITIGHGRQMLVLDVNESDGVTIMMTRTGEHEDLQFLDLPPSAVRRLGRWIANVAGSLEPS